MSPLREGTNHTVERGTSMTLYQEDSQQPGTENESDTRMNWIPLNALVEQWATFGGTSVSYPALMATSTVFSAFSLETSALRLYNEACSAKSRSAEITVRALLEQVIDDLQQASSRWMSTLYWLERFASGEHHDTLPLDTIRTLFFQTTEQLERLGLLQRQVYRACAQFYQQHGMLVDAQIEGEQE